MRLNKITEYVLLFLLIGLSGNPMFLYSKPIMGLSMIGITLIYAIQVLKNKKRYFIFKKNLLPYIFLVFFIFLVQTLKFNQFNIKSTIVLISNLLVSVFVIAIVKEQFYSKFVFLVTRLALISLIIHVSIILVPPILNFLVAKVVPLVPGQTTYDTSLHRYHIFIHNFWQIDIFRNSGFYWEPGVNAGFSLLALFLNLNIFKKGLNYKWNIILLINIISTISTTGLIALFVLLFLHFNTKKSTILRAFFISIMLVIGYFTFTNNEFLYFKVNQQLSNISSNARESRFASALLDFQTFKEHPISGYPSNDLILDKYQLSNDHFRTNGVFILLAQYGILYFLIYWFLLYKSSFRIFNYYILEHVKSKKLAIHFIIVMLLIGFSENYFLKPIFVSFILLYAYTPKSSLSENITLNKT